jgi:hypothetical protein
MVDFELIKDKEVMAKAIALSMTLARELNAVKKTLQSLDELLGDDEGNVGQFSDLKQVINDFQEDTFP